MGLPFSTAISEASGDTSGAATTDCWMSEGDVTVDYSWQITAVVISIYKLTNQVSNQVFVSQLARQRQVRQHNVSLSMKLINRSASLYVIHSEPSRHKFNCTCTFLIRYSK